MNKRITKRLAAMALVATIVSQGATLYGTPVIEEVSGEGASVNSRSTGYDVDSFYENAAVNYVFSGEDRLFDGTRTIDETVDLDLIKNFDQGTILVKAKLDIDNIDENGIYSILGFGSENATTTVNRMAQMFGVSYINGKAEARYEMSNGLYSNRGATMVNYGDGEWHTIAYVFGDGRIFASGDGRSTVGSGHTTSSSFDGFLTRNTGMNSITIGGIEGVETNSDRNPYRNWIGEIAQITITDEVLSIQDANTVTAAAKESMETTSAPQIGPHADQGEGRRVVSLRTDTTGATIYYTLDGTEPTVDSLRYTGPITLRETKTVKAIAVKEGLKDSDVSTMEVAVKSAFTLEDFYNNAILNYTFTGEDRVFDGTKTVDETVDVAAIQDLSEGTIVVTAKLNEEAIGTENNYAFLEFGSGMGTEQVLGIKPTVEGLRAHYDLGKGLASTAAMPIDFEDGQWHTLAFNFKNGEIFVSGDGKTDLTSESGHYLDSTLDGFLTRNEDMNSMTLGGAKDPAYLPWLGEIAQIIITDEILTVSQANEVTADGKITLDPIQETVVLADGKDTDKVREIALSTDTVGAAIYYTLDGSEPTEESTLYTSPITLTETTQVKAIAIREGLDVSDVMSVRVEVGKIIEEAVAPEIVVGGVETDKERVVTLSTATEGATLYYTLDGSRPSAESMMYTGPITLTESVRLNVVAVKEGMLTSQVSGRDIEVGKILGQANTPIIVASGIETDSIREVSITNTTDSAIIYYTLDGTMPTEESLVYEGPISLSETTQISAIATQEAMLASEVATETIVVGKVLEQVSAPEIVVGGVDTDARREVEIKNTTDSAIIYYTLDGTTPTTESTVYNDTLNLTETTHVKAIAVKEGMLPSRIVHKEVVVGQEDNTQDTPQDQTVAPSILVGGVDTDLVRQVQLMAGAPNTTLYYTLDGSTPTEASMVYDGTITLTETTQVKAMAVAEGMEPSRIVSREVVVGKVVEEDDQVVSDKVSTPEIIASGEEVDGTRQVTLTTATPGATLYYSLGGNRPTALYEGPITIVGPATVRAMAVKEGMKNSHIVEETVIANRNEASCCELNGFCH